MTTIIDNPITITVSGTCGSGKSTVAYTIAQYLKAIGLTKVDVIEPYEECTKVTDRHLDVVLTKDPSIIIREVQMSRSSATRSIRNNQLNEIVQYLEGTQSGQLICAVANGTINRDEVSTDVVEMSDLLIRLRDFL